MKHRIEDAKDRLGLSFREPQSIETHLEAAATWILEAQRATPDDGVAQSYDLRRTRWLPSDPTTTGYLIATLYDYALYFDRPVVRDAASKMARWEVDVQLSDGGVRSGHMGVETVSPTTFGTGQVLFGLARAATESGAPTIRESLVRAADWLVAAQDADGCWRRFGQPSAETENDTYQTRSAFGLVRAHDVVQDARYLDAADRNIAWALSTALPNRWLRGNAPTSGADARASTHAVAYAVRGIVEVGVATENPQYIKAALAMARRVAEHQRNNGSLSGDLSPEWKPLGRWTCMTGNAQMALNWYRLAKITGERELMQNARAANRFNRSLQTLTGLPATRGAIEGSHPIGTGSLAWNYPSRTAKFFMDALMFERLFDRIDNIG